ncbi:DUF6153 family protein [Streptomyces scabiei]|uniref:DUF6153 family protein n=1 Tax=Streptomyces scabiei TaxID=1930 RepID=UPI001B304A16|nr:MULTISPECIES: DUF6153 family protein [Streptomyces]MBP5859507.1 hypothetical protein [Streptomyces sp. LBUM 1484]MBP5880299.1 hypothetical protein [Streptomyces sp. LBUM 1477]MBP5888139.1 hypothetical protein [Streptomyces sp. LBUM 1487]MBP5889280.1 hypothetical protein [Streptomyces sp. LBUM 1481]MBP5904153.1 hypothetical protein [Streptomyces sp. LBUM 1488]
MRAGRCVRAGGALGQLLLVAVLALGVLVMHGMGHPAESAHSTTGRASAMAATDPLGASAAHHGPTGSAVGGTTDGHGVAGASDPSSSHGPAMAMDMLSLCVAVLLGGWVLSALLASALTRCRTRSAQLLARVAAAARPNPPPRGPDPTRLSVLRL